MIKNSKDIKLVIIGLGYVGLPLALEFAKKRDIVGYDINEKRVNDLKIGIDKNLEFNKNHLKIMKNHSVIMHPLPRRNEISIELDNEPQAIYWRQMRNGMWIRAALILSTFGRDSLINHWKEK